MPVGPDELPRIFAGLLALAEGRYGGERGDLRRAAQATREGGARDEEPAALRERLPGERGVGVELCAHSKRDVDSLLDQIDAPIGGDDLQGDTRVALHERGPVPPRSGRLCICWPPLIEEGRDLSSMSGILADSSYRLLPA